MLIKLGGMHYEYEITGSGDALLLLHGFTGSKDVWRRFFPLWSHDLQVIAVDLPGHGKTDSPSDWARYSIEQTAADMIALLDALKIKQAHVLGYSMGGRLAITIASLYAERVRSLVLESCTPGLESEEEREERKRQDQQQADFIMEHGLEAFVERWENIPLFASQQQLPYSVREQMRQQRLQNNPLGLANSLRGMGTGMQPSWWSSLHRLCMPVLLLGGEYDEKFLRILQCMEQRLPNAEFVQVSGAGHTIHVEQPEKFDTIVRSFFQAQYLEGGL
ncbi:2-succinyl-6-hydroxy-2,4-cyclohexadiene-1-carboxylate synthase [Ectobacillus funiculus]|uniref:2-succinyl-6-hydroxy-2, 4-cyclohexadiene-1-carboxylate synthase n=1 Tax=Ectobacillus funiculus TaxID=137993 RepID=UPI00397BA56F